MIFYPVHFHMNFCLNYWLKSFLLMFSTVIQTYNLQNWSFSCLWNQSTPSFYSNIISFIKMQQRCQKCASAECCLLWSYVDIWMSTKGIHWIRLCSILEYPRSWLCGCCILLPKEVKKRSDHNMKICFVNIVSYIAEHAFVFPAWRANLISIANSTMNTYVLLRNKYAVIKGIAVNIL